MSAQPNGGEDSSKGKDCAAAFGIAVLTAVIGGYLCALAIDQFGEIGGISLLVLGWAVGSAARNIMSRPRKAAGLMIGAAVVIAMLVAEICWIRWNIRDVDGWSKAISLLPQFCKEYQMSALMAAVFALFGATSAYSRAGVRYRLVKVIEDD